MSWVGRCRPTSSDPYPIDLIRWLYTHIQESCIPLDECFALLLLIIVLNYVKSSSEKCVPIVHPHIGKKISNLVSLPFNMLENDHSIGMEPLFKSFQYGLESPTVGNFVHVSTIEKMIFQIDEDAGITLHLQRLETMTLG